MSEEYLTMIDWEEMFKDGNIEISMVPKLPTMKVKYNGWNYEMPDLRYLDKVAVQMFLNCIRHAGLTKGARCAEFLIDYKDFSKEELRVITDILIGFHVKATKKGKNGGSGFGSFLICGCCLTSKNDESGKLKVEFATDHADSIYEYFQEHDLDATFPLIEIIDYCEQKSRARMTEWLERNYEQSC